MSQVKIPRGAVISQLCIGQGLRPDGLQTRVKLELVNGGGATFAVTDSTVLSMTQTKTEIELTPLAAGTASIVETANGKSATILKVTVGTVTNDTGMKVDLLADLGRSDDARKLDAYRRALDPNNNAVSNDSDTWAAKLAGQPFKQNTTPGKYDCGETIGRFGKDLFGGVSLTYGKAYYLKPTSDRMDDLQMDVPALTGGMKAIRKLLDDKKTVRVFVAHLDGFTTPVITNTAHTHFLSIIGYGGDSNDKFLYIDPWPGGSKLKYTSGIFGNVSSAFMGTLYFDGKRLTNVAHGSHDYVVIAGPA